MNPGCVLPSWKVLYTEAPWNPTPDVHQEPWLSVHDLRDCNTAVMNARGTVCMLLAGSTFIPEHNTLVFSPGTCHFCTETHWHCYLSGVTFISASHI